MLTPKPPIRLRTEDGELVQKVRLVADRKFLWKGKEVMVESRLIDPDTKKVVPTGEVIEVLVHSKNKLLKANCEEVKKTDIFQYAVQGDGSESLVKPFSKTQTIDLSNDESWIPATSIEGFLIKDVYEMFTETRVDAVELWQECEKRLKQDQIGIITYVREEGFKQFYAFVCPLMREGKFDWLIKLSDNQVELRQQQNIPSKVKVPIKEAPTLATLPPVQALVLAAKSRN